MCANDEELLRLPYQNPMQKIPAVYKAKIVTMPKKIPTSSTVCLTVDL